MKLYIMRHGETDWNKERRLQGQADIPLNELGRRIAVQTGEGMKRIPFVKAYSSPLVRASETAHLVLGKRQTEIVEDERLREMAFGEYEGLCCAEDNWEIPDPEFKRFFLSPDTYTPPAGGESFSEVLTRVGDFLLALTEQNYGVDDHILVICHGVVVNAFMNIVENKNISQFWGERVQKNCAVNIIEVKNQEFHLLKTGVIYYTDQVRDW